LFAAETMTGRQGHTANALPMDKILALLKKYNKIKGKE
jgi:D-aminopeptidase